ncbi:Uncharacterised protein [Serratia proteamaculans]|uniref:hypothetical protein n=1 Tax=Serratia proteamaculans TaxID=28151 RepID=UPI0021796F23|nr:hypothetical protein [Serratia proteamaculans]CAI1559835.1 Uncharacterised protein [Serratia proteamaculans]
MSHQHKRCPFVSLSRRNRRKKAIKIKNLIYKERHRCGGVFYDESDFTQFDEEPERVWGWSDIYFSGLDPAVFWNTEIITAQVALEDIVHSRAFDEAYILLNEQQRECELKIETYPNHDNKGKIVSHTLINKKEYEYTIFDGLTFDKYVKKREHEIARDTPPIIYPCYRYLPHYVYGLGLRMIVDVPSLNRKIIEDTIIDFRLRGEREWYSPKPVSFATPGM